MLNKLEKDFAYKRESEFFGKFFGNSFGIFLEFFWNFLGILLEFSGNSIGIYWEFLGCFLGCMVGGSDLGFLWVIFENSFWDYFCNSFGILS